MKYSLPDSAGDLLIKDGKLLVRSLSIYEILRRFSHIIQLSPFRFEDFTAALLADEQSPLLADVHIQLLKTLVREDRQQQTWLCTPDLRDSVNIYLQLLDHACYPAALKIYLSADGMENKEVLNVLEGYGLKNYPFNEDLDVKLKVLEKLCDQFLLSNLAREEIVNGSSTITNHDTTCRSCGKSGGPLIECQLCPAIYHLACSDPPLEKYPNPEGDVVYSCATCRANTLTGVTNCLGLEEKDGNLKRHEALGIDDEGRRFWFIARRLFVIDENEDDVRYYSKLEDFHRIVESLGQISEEDPLTQSIFQHREEIERQMKITDDLYDSILKPYKQEDGTYSRYLGQDNAHRNYVNHFSAPQAIGKNQSYEKDISRTLGNKFCMTAINSFKWSGAINGHLQGLTVTIRSSILKFEANIPTAFIHPCWAAYKPTWAKLVNYAQGPEDFAKALSEIECAIKPVIFKTTWYEGVGFTQLFRSTLVEREELKKTERQPRGFEKKEWVVQDFEISQRQGTLVKYSSRLKPVKHQVWKQKGEEYRLTGLNGWLWRSSVHSSRLLARPRLMKAEPIRWLEPMTHHPFIVDMVNEAIRTCEVIDVATELSKEDSHRILYPKKIVLNSYKQKRVTKLEGLLKLKLDDLEKAKKISDADSATSPTNANVKKIKMENGDSLPVKPGDQIQNGTANVSKSTIPNVTSPQTTPKIATQAPNSHPNTPSNITPLKINASSPKKCIFAKPKMPPCHDFLTKRHKKRSILVLPDLELRKLARSGGLRETKSFSYTAKQSNHVWPYGMTPRPVFRNCWLFRNRLINTMQEAALQFKVLYASIRWDDLQVRPHPSGANVIVTDEATIRIELLKKRDRLPYLTRSEYLIKKVTTPIEEQNSTKSRKSNYSRKSTATTPSARSGLRARRQTMEEEPKGPTVEQVWVTEDQLELWEIKLFNEKIERQTQFLRERAMRDEAARKRRLEEERRKKADEEKRQEAAKRTITTPAKIAVTSVALNRAGTPNAGQTVTPTTPSTPVLRYFRTDQGHIIRLPVSYLQRGTPLILRHVGPGATQTSTYIIPPQTPRFTSAGANQSTTPILTATPTAKITTVVTPNTPKPIVSTTTANTTTTATTTTATSNNSSITNSSPAKTPITLPTSITPTVAANASENATITSNSSTNNLTSTPMEETPTTAASTATTIKTETTETSLPTNSSTSMPTGSNSTSAASPNTVIIATKSPPTTTPTQMETNPSNNYVLSDSTVKMEQSQEP